MLDPHMLIRITVFDAAGGAICSETSGRNAPPAERGGCACGATLAPAPQIPSK
jgi:hypothetical protein